MSVANAVPVAAVPLSASHSIVTSAGGVTEARTFYVGPYATVMEKEPNSDFQAPQKVAFNSTVQGVVLSEDVGRESVGVNLRLALRIGEQIDLAVGLFEGLDDLMFGQKCAPGQYLFRRPADRMPECG